MFKVRRLPNFLYLASLVDWKSFRISRNASKIERSQTINDLRNIAQKKAPKAVFDYVEGGAGEEISYKDRKSTRLNSSHEWISRMPSSA